jgi:hypothetical protein
MSQRAPFVVTFAHALALLLSMLSVAAWATTAASPSPAPADTGVQASAPSSTAASSTMGKPAAHDPVRAHIVRAIRQHPALSALQGQRLDIRRIWVSAHWGYVCTLVVTPGGVYQGSEGAFEVLQIVLQREGEVWTPVARLDGLSESSRRVQCASDAQGQITEAFLSDLASNQALALKPRSQP